MEQAATCNCGSGLSSELEADVRKSLVVSSPGQMERGWMCEKRYAAQQQEGGRGKSSAWIGDHAVELT